MKLNLPISIRIRISGMSLYSLPLVILNLGGEMFYVLDQRLKAQHHDVPATKARKILDEIATTLFDEVFIHEIFKPQPLYHKKELYLLFKDIAHASIIKLNDISMGKLYDLMIMVFKYQLYATRQPREILLITLNHLHSLRNLVISPNVLKQMDSVYYLFMKTYYSMYDAELQHIRFDLLNYLQDIHIKVSICLRLGLQNDDGTFVNPFVETLPYGSEIPGVIKYLNKDESLGDVTAFPPGGEYIIDQEKACFELKCAKGTTLGTSIYQEKSFAQDYACSSGDNLEQQISSIKTSDYHSEMKTLLSQLLSNTKNNVTGGDENEIVLLDLFIDEQNKRNEDQSDEAESIKTVTLWGTTEGQNNSGLEAAATQISAKSLDQTDPSEEENNLFYLLENTE